MHQKKVRKMKQYVISVTIDNQKRYLADGALVEDISNALHYASYEDAVTVVELINASKNSYSSLGIEEDAGT